MMSPTQKALDQAPRATGSLRHNLGFDHSARAEQQRAKSLWLNSLDLLENADGSELTRLAHFLNHLASVYEERGDYAKTERLYQRLTRLVERTGTDPEMEGLRVVVLRRLGSLYQAQGRHDEAETVLRRALASAQTIFGLEHPETAEAFHHLALLQQERDRFDKAAKYYQRALAVFEQALQEDGPSYLRVADLCHDLSRLESRRGNPAAGEPAARRALQIRSRALGGMHPSVAAEMASLAEILVQQGKCDEAERLYRQAIDIIETHHGGQHYEIATMLANLAGIYATRGSDTQAEQCYLRALAIKERLLGVENLEVAALRDHLAALYVQQGRYDEAQTVPDSTIFDRATGILRS